MRNNRFVILDEPGWAGQACLGLGAGRPGPDRLASGSGRAGPARAGPARSGWVGAAWLAQPAGLGRLA